jgi:ketosteroid isomerase-like protein
MNTRIVVENYFNAMREGRFADMQMYVSTKQKYWISGDGSWAFGGYNTPESMSKLWSIVMERFPNGLNLTINSILTDGEYAAVQVHNNATRIDGKVYDNDVFVHLRVQNGLITEQREYLDTIMINELFCGELEDQH